nr:o-succinylbenzoate synthase [Allomuricauda sp.]
MKASYTQYILNFKRPSGTSRGVMNQKETWFLIVEHQGKKGIGECGILRGLSVDDVPDYEEKLQWLCNNINMPSKELFQELVAYPSIQFGLEQALLSLESDDPLVLFPSHFTGQEAPISINGLIWMGDEQFMLSQLEEKLEAGFNCIKMKIGAIDFKQELGILEVIRKRFSPKDIEIRVDANGAFKVGEALDKLNQLSQFQLHSIEQPIKAKQWRAMADLCRQTPLPIALDEELIGVFSVTDKVQLLQTIQPQFIILKPSLVGGFESCREWIQLAESRRVGWWITSALESNVGLNAIAQWTFTLQTRMPQGLGTGSLFTNNFDSPLEVLDGKLYYRNNKKWKTNLIENLCI